MFRYAKRNVKRFQLAKKSGIDEETIHLRFGFGRDKPLVDGTTKAVRHNIAS